MDKPGLAILVGQALAKKGKASAPEGDEPEGDEQDQHLQEISDELVDAFESKDSKAVKELLQEFFMACDSPEETPKSE
jgi:hypothetical protein